LEPGGIIWNFSLDQSSKEYEKASDLDPARNNKYLQLVLFFSAQ
jgi:hypothetical protein